MHNFDGAVARLRAFGFVEDRAHDRGLGTTPRWQAAMARAALRLRVLGDDGFDLRVPIAAALVDLRPDLDVDDVVELVAAMLPIELGAGVPKQEVVAHATRAIDE